MSTNTLSYMNEDSRRLYESRPSDRKSMKDKLYGFFQHFRKKDQTEEKNNDSKDK